jgi:cell division protein FtsL
VLLVGIVAMQVEVLKLNAGIGRSLERASALQGQNELLRAGVARLSDEQRIERIAAGMGMVMPSADQMRFVRTGPASVESALNAIKAPDATNFLAQLPAIGAPAAAQGAAVNTGIGTTAVTATGTTAAASGTSATSAAASSTTSVSSAATQPTQSTSATSTATSAPVGAGGSTTASGSGSPAAASPVTPAAPPTTAGTTGQSSPSSTGGATPVGG